MYSIIVVQCTMVECGYKTMVECSYKTDFLCTLKLWPTFHKAQEMYQTKCNLAVQQICLICFTACHENVKFVQEHRFCQELADALKLPLHWLLLERI